MKWPFRKNSDHAANPSIPNTAGEDATRKPSLLGETLNGFLKRQPEESTSGDGMPSPHITYSARTKTEHGHIELMPGVFLASEEEEDTASPLVAPSAPMEEPAALREDTPPDAAAPLNTFLATADVPMEFSLDSFSEEALAPEPAEAVSELAFPDASTLSKADLPAFIQENNLSFISLPDSAEPTDFSAMTPEDTAFWGSTHLLDDVSPDETTAEPPYPEPPSLDWATAQILGTTALPLAPEDLAPPSSEPVNLPDSSIEAHQADTTETQTDWSDFNLLLAPSDDLAMPAATTLSLAEAFFQDHPAEESPMWEDATEYGFFDPFLQTEEQVSEVSSELTAPIGVRADDSFDHWDALPADETTFALAANDLFGESLLDFSPASEADFELQALSPPSLPIMTEEPLSPPPDSHPILYYQDEDTDEPVPDDEADTFFLPETAVFEEPNPLPTSEWGAIEEDDTALDSDYYSYDDNFDVTEEEDGNEGFYCLDAPEAQATVAATPTAALPLPENEAVSDSIFLLNTAPPFMPAEESESAPPEILYTATANDILAYVDPEPLQPLTQDNSLLANIRAEYDDMPDNSSLNDFLMLGPSKELLESAALSEESFLPPITRPSELPTEAIKTAKNTQKSAYQLPFPQAPAHSLSHALDNFEASVILQESRFMKRSIDALVDRYFSQQGNGEFLT